MNFLGKLRVTRDRTSPQRSSAAPPVAAPRAARQSNALKDFLWLLGDAEHGHLLDLGTVWQSTVSFFIDRGFKVYSEDLLRTWKDFLIADEARRYSESRARGRGNAEEPEPADPAELAGEFLQANLNHPAETFHAVLAWDVFDYLAPAAAARFVARLHELLRPGGVVLAVFHSRRPEGFSRYRILDTQNIEVLPAPALLEPARIFQNREILNLFEAFRSAKTFVGRDQLREGLFAK